MNFKQRLFTLLAVALFPVWLGAQDLALPVDFESTTISYDFEDFSGGNSTVIPNPNVDATNGTANTAQMIKSDGEVFGGSFLTLTNPIDFSADRIFKVLVYAPRAGARLLLKVENVDDGAIFFEREDTTSVANAWEELTFDFTQINASQSYSKLVFIFDIGTVGDSSANFTFLFDEIQLVNGGPILDQIDLPITFEDPDVDYTLTDFEGASTSLVADPEDATNTVARTVKPTTAGSVAGTTMSTDNGLATAIPITADETQMSVEVYSPDAGIPVRLKIEDANDPTRSVETEATTTTANAWETLVFDFTNEATGTSALDLSYTYSKATIFFNFGTDGATAGEKIYFWDNAAFGSETTSIGNLAELGLEVYPNPSSGIFNLLTTMPSGEVKVLNLMGQEVHRQPIEARQTVLNLPHLPTGWYHLQVTTEAGAESVQVHLKK